MLQGIRALALVAVVILSMAPAATGSAGPVDDRRDFEAAYHTITDTVTNEAPTAEDELLARKHGWKCRTVTSKVTSYSLVNTKLWSYRQKLGWCWSRGEIRSATPRCQGTYATVDAPLWDFVGHVECQSSGGVGQSFVRRWRQGKFRACAAWCFQTKLPYVWVRGYADGGWERGGGW